MRPAAHGIFVAERTRDTAIDELIFLAVINEESHACAADEVIIRGEIPPVIDFFVVICEDREHGEIGIRDVRDHTNDRGIIRGIPRRAFHLHSGIVGGEQIVLVHVLHPPHESAKRHVQSIGDHVVKHIDRILIEIPRIFRDEGETRDLRHGRRGNRGGQKEREEHA